MNRRNLLLACTGIAAAPVAVSMPYSIEELIIHKLQLMKVGDSITITKMSDGNWRLTGDIGERIK